MNSKLITIKTFTDSPEAHVVKTHLESEGIKCHLRNEGIIEWVLPTTICNVELQVKEEDLEKAMKLIDVK